MKNPLTTPYGALELDPANPIGAIASHESAFDTIKTPIPRWPWESERDKNKVAARSQYNVILGGVYA